MEIAARERGDFQLRLRLQRCERLRPRLALRLRPQCQPLPKLFASLQPKAQLEDTALAHGNLHVGPSDDREKAESTLNKL